MSELETAYLAQTLPVNDSREGGFVEWNNSALSLLERCGEAFRRRYIQGEIIPPSPRMVRGTAVHRVATLGFLRKVAGEPLPSVEEAKDLAATAFDATWNAGISLSTEEVAEGIGKVQGESKDFAVDLSGFHVERVAPGIHPIGVERKIIVKPKDSDLVIHGTLDLVAATPDGTEVIRDLKTSQKSPNKNAAEVSQQLSMYALLRWAEVGRLPSSLVLDYLIRTPIRQEKKHILLETVRTQENVQTIVNRLNVAVEAVKKGIFIPASPESWWCAKEWCSYWDSCPYVSKGGRRPEL